VHWDEIKPSTLMINQEMEIADASIAKHEIFSAARHGHIQERNVVETDTAGIVRSCRRPGDGGLHQRCWSRYSDRAGRSFLPQWK
jgi:hypothetical protein